MTKHRYDPVDMYLSLQDGTTGTPVDAAETGASTASAPERAIVAGAAEPPSAASPRAVRRSTRTQMNLNVDPATKQRLRELWRPIAAEHSQGEIVDLLVERWGSDAAAELAARSGASSTEPT